MNELEANNLTDWLTEEERKYMGTVGKYYSVRRAKTSDIIKKKIQDQIKGTIRAKISHNRKKVIAIPIPNEELKIAFKDRCGVMPMSIVIRWLMVKYIEGDYGDYERKNTL